MVPFETNSCVRFIVWRHAAMKKPTLSSNRLQQFVKVLRKRKMDLVCAFFRYWQLACSVIAQLYRWFFHENSPKWKLQFNLLRTYSQIDIPLWILLKINQPTNRPDATAMNSKTENHFTKTKEGNERTNERETQKMNPFYLTTPHRIASYRIEQQPKYIKL